MAYILKNLGIKPNEMAQYFFVKRSNISSLSNPRMTQSLFLRSSHKKLTSLLTSKKNVRPCFDLIGRKRSQKSYNQRSIFDGAIQPNSGFVKNDSISRPMDFSFFISTVTKVFSEALTIPGPWWSRDQCSRLLLRRSQFESSWLLFYVVRKDENKWKRGRGWPFKKTKPLHEKYWNIRGQFFNGYWIGLLLCQVRPH